MVFPVHALHLSRCDSALVVLHSYHIPVSSQLLRYEADSWRHFVCSWLPSVSVQQLTILWFQCGDVTVAACFLMWLVNRFRGLLNPTTEDGGSLKSASHLDTVQVIQWEMPSLLETEKHFRKNSCNIMHFVTPLLHRQVRVALYAWVPGTMYIWISAWSYTELWSYLCSLNG